MGKHMQRHDYIKYSIYPKIVITFLVMLILIFFSGVAAVQISALEEESCWNVLEQTAQRTSDEVRDRIKSDQELLESIATIIEGMDSLDSPNVQKIIDEFRPNTMISHIALLLPGDFVMIPNEPIRNANGILSFEEEAALGTHISDRSVDIRDESRLILRNFVPLYQDGQIAAMLYGVVDLQALPEQLDRSAYHGNIQITIMNAQNGDYIVDTWHETLGNTDDFVERELVDGQSPKALIQKALEGEPGYSVFVSKSLGENLYFYSMPAKINHWVVGIHVPESLVFEKMTNVNRLLVLFMGIEILVLAGYFLWILFVTRKELMEQKRLADTDVLTGLLNRNCFEKSIEGIPAQCKEQVTCIYVDANGLHELNNTKGHKAGDTMLKEVAGAIQKQFGEKNTYRIGGDEFVAFSMDETPEAIQEKVDEIVSYTSKNGYSVSVGMCRESTPIHMDRLIKQAETEMYTEKRRYYAQAGKDRRNRDRVSAC